MRSQFKDYRVRVENIILKMISRGDAFFEETIRLGRIFDLLKSEKIKAQFEQQVVADTEARIDATVEELIDWMVERDLRIWQDVTEYIDRQRLRRYADELIGEVSGQFRYDRRSLLESVASRAQDEIDRYDAGRRPTPSPSRSGTRSPPWLWRKRARSASARSWSPPPRPSPST